MAEVVQYSPREEGVRPASRCEGGAEPARSRQSSRGRMFKRASDTGEAMAAHGALAPTRLGMAIEEQWPALKLVGFGFYYAWIWISYNSNVLVSPAAAYDLPPDTISQTYLASTLALAVALVALSLLRRFTERLMASNGAVALIALAVGAATVGTYASSSLGAEGNLLLLASGALTGLGTSVVVLRFGIIYGKVPAHDAVMYTAASFVFACMIYFVAIGLPDPVGMGFTALLPLMAVLSTLTNAEFASESALPSRPSRAPLKAFFVRLLIAVAVFSVVVGVSRGFAVPHSQVACMNEEGAIVVFGTGVVAAALFLVVGLLGRRFDVSRMYYPIIMVVAACILVTPLVGGTGFGSQFITIGYNCFVLVIWCLLAYVAYSSPLSSIVVFGLGRGASALGTTLGWMVGLALVRAHGESTLSLEVVSVAMVFALLVVSMLVLNDRLIGEALRYGAGTERREGPSDVAKVSPATEEGEGTDRESAAGEDGECASETVLAGAAASTAAEVRRPGRYQARCRAVAERCGLTARERDVFDLLVRGRSIDYIAQNLTISFNTAKSHIRHIYVKTDVHSRQELLDLIDREESSCPISSS